jgi:hypothetical protein
LQNAQQLMPLTPAVYEGREVIHNDGLREVLQEMHACCVLPQIRSSTQIPACMQLHPLILHSYTIAGDRAHGMQGWCWKSAPHVDVEESRVMAVHALRQQRGHLLYLVLLADEQHRPAPCRQGVGVVEKDGCLATAPPQFACM